MAEVLTINKSYAVKYEKRKKAEELSRLQEKYGDDLGDDSSDSTSEEEDDDAEEDTTDKSKDFLRTLSLLKKRDPRIYDMKTGFYRDSSADNTTIAGNTGTKSTNKEGADRPMYLKDYERQRLLERGEMAGVSSDSEGEGDGRGNPLGVVVSVDKMSYDQEQRELRESFRKSVPEAPTDDILTVRHKTEKEKQEEEAEYVKWLKGHKAELQSEEMSDMDALRRYWTDPNLDPDEAFLRDYILNKKWVDPDTKQVVRHYEDIVADPVDPSEDENEIDKQDKFEETYNFRFEEPGGSKISSYPRTIESSLRKEDMKRKDKRKEREERKAKEKEQKKEEIRRLKNLKKQEILEKLEKIKQITGNPVVGFNEEDFEADFDPAHHDQMMQQQFNEDYYEEGVAEEEKPEFSDLSDKEEDWDNWDPPTEDHAPYCEDPDFNMDADYNPEGEGEGAEPVSNRKRRRQNVFSRAVKRNKPSFDPEGEKGFEEYFDEFYKLDYEDLIGGDLPCRFHYRQTVPNDFGLSAEEVLMSEDKELNKWASLKKAVQYRSKDEEKSDVKKYAKKSNDVNKKKRILASMATTTTGDDDEGEGSGSTSRQGGGKRTGEKKKGRGKGAAVDSRGGLSESRLSAYGIKRDKKHRTKNKRK